MITSLILLYFLTIQASAVFLLILHYLIKEDNSL
jgi:hypothetical protein